MCALGAEKGREGEKGKNLLAKKRQTGRGASFSSFEKFTLCAITHADNPQPRKI